MRKSKEKEGGGDDYDQSMFHNVSIGCLALPQIITSSAVFYKNRGQFMKVRAYGTEQLTSFSLLFKNHDSQFWKAVKLNFISKIHDIC